MSNPVEKQPNLSSEPNAGEQTLSQWIYQTIGADPASIKFHRRGNNLHLLYEGGDCPDRVTLLQRMLTALQQTDLNMMIAVDEPHIYQIHLYACVAGVSHPAWTTTIYLNQLESHWVQLEAEAAASAPAKTGSNATALELSPSPPAATGSALAVSNRSLARQGHETAIASYLSETLSQLGVAVRVSVKTIPFTASSTVCSTDVADSPITTRRLWVACDAPYSPEPSLIGEAVTQKLRDLEITGYRDAVIRFQVTGETEPDWLLRVDLTPPEEMLREWARWGDVEAIQRLLNQSIAHLGHQFSEASLKEQTLHLVCKVMPPDGAEVDAQPQAPEVSAVLSEITPILEGIAPQGIHAAAIYGQITDRNFPEWVEWLNLPASLHPALSDSALTLAHQGDLEAVAFLLHRLLNADLEQYLATGGIRLKLLPKQDLLHIMSEAVVCPEQRHVGYVIVRFLEPLKLPNLAGVRIYGRRAGQKHPVWSYGVDFVPRGRMVPEAAPEFAATDAYVKELMTPRDGSPFRPDLTPTDLRRAWTNFVERSLTRLQKTLLRSKLFMGETDSTESKLALPNQADDQGLLAMLAWGTLGVLLTLQANWLLALMLRQGAESSPPISAVPTAPSPTLASPPPSPDSPASVVSSTQPIEQEEPPEFQFPKLQLNQSEDGDETAFIPDGFIESVPTSPLPFPESPSPNPSQPSTPQASPSPVGSALPYTSQNLAVNLALAESIAAESEVPNFNSRQFNDKLSLYYRVLEETGTPDILIVGSSRALRGVDPTALESALAELGYRDVSVFNFGVNGATAQVVELLLQQVLTPDQLPRLVLWADGARAFNSNAEDVTYNGIAASPAYQDLVQGTLVLPTVNQPGQSSNAPIAAGDQGINITLTDSYQALDRWASRQLARFSGLYESRDRLKEHLQQGLTYLLPATTAVPAVPPGGVPLAQTNLPSDYELVDASGFLSLGVQFNPATYYQQYARVTGAYDRDYSNFRIPGVQQDALLSILEYMQAQQIPVVFVNLPLTDEYLDSVRMDFERDFREYMVRLGLEQPGFTFRDIGKLWITRYDYFSDPSHLNRYGAYAVAQHLAQDPLIPWNRSRSPAPNRNQALR